MPESLQALAVAILVAPGFLAFFISKELAPDADDSRSDWEMLLLSLLLTLPLVAFWAALIGSALLIWSDLPALGGLRPSELSDGFSNAVQRSPARVLSIAGAQYLVHCTVLILIGYWDPIGSILDARRKARGLSSANVVRYGIHELSEAQGDKSYLRQGGNARRRWLLLGLGFGRLVEAQSRW